MVMNGRGVAETRGDHLRDFFVSYTAVDEDWARWIVVSLEEAGYTTFSQTFDMRPGNDFTHAMHEAITRAHRIIAVLSPSYLLSPFGEAEWRAILADDPSGELARVVPVMVERCEPTGLLRSRIYIDLVDVDEDTACAKLLAGIVPVDRPRVAGFPPAFRRDGRAVTVEAVQLDAPSVSNLPRRNRNFAGRDDVLALLRDRLTVSRVAAVLPVEAIHGLGGIGKSELATEYGHRYAGDYDLIWWVNAEDPLTATSELARLARHLGVVEDGVDETAALRSLFDHLRLRNRWLLIYDNAEHPAWLEGVLPAGGSGSVIVTSRWSTWARFAEPLQLEVLRRAESVAYLDGRLRPDGGAPRLAELAELLGDLPLALEEAASYIETTAISPADYLDLVRRRERDLFGPSPHQSPPSLSRDHRTVATTWSLALDRVRAEDDDAENLLTMASFLAPEIPRALLRTAAAFVPGARRDAGADELMFSNSLAALGRYSVVTLRQQALVVHRLVGAVVRARLDVGAERGWAAAAAAFVLATLPETVDGPADAALRDLLLPHVPVVIEHAQRLGVADAEVTGLLDRTAGGQERSGLAELDQLDALATRAAAGHPLETEAFLAAVRPLLDRYVRGRLGEDGSEDVLQEVLLKLVLELPEYDAASQSILATGYGIARRQVDDALGDRIGWIEDPVRAVPDVGDPESDPSLLVAGTEGRDRLNEVLDQLPPLPREVIVLRIGLGYSANEAARITGLTPGVVRVVEHRAMTTLRRLLDA